MNAKYLFRPGKVDLQFIVRASPKMHAGGRSFFIINFGTVHVATKTILMSQPNTQHTLVIFHCRYHGPCKETGSCNLLYSISWTIVQNVVL